MMIPAEWSSTLANHLWQSTVLAAVAWALTLALRENQARMRYRIWLIASLKFLIPFSLLITIGAQVRWTTSAPVTQPRLSAVVQQFTQFTQPFAQTQALGGVATEPAPHKTGFLPIVLLTVWTCGFLAVALSRWRQWLRIRGAVRAASPLTIEGDVPVMSSPTLLEPGIFGISRPVLLLPEGISDRLSPEHLRAIVAHELCHVRHRDNLAAAIHMAIEAIFWFHPLVWWIGSRLVEERERACDEEVLRLGSKPAVYAESILKTCQFYLESPLACVSGITGSDLKKRIVRIMTQHLAERLTLSRKLLLAGVAIAIIAGPLLSGLASQTIEQSASSVPLPSFDVASIKPNNSGERRVMFDNTQGMFRAVNVTPKILIEFAYNIKDSQLSGGPGWITSDHYDVEAKAEDAGQSTQPPTPELVDQRAQRRRLMLQSLLADRFKLTITRETKDLPIYALVVTKDGPKFHQSPPMPSDTAATPPGPPDPPAPGQPLRGRGTRFMMGRGQLNMNDAPMSAFTDALARQLGRNVVDKTGLKGNYDLALQWTPDEGQNGQFFGGTGGPDGRLSGDSAPPPDASGPSIFTALQEQLGLKLESEKGPVETLVIRSIEKPSEN